MTVPLSPSPPPLTPPPLTPALRPPVLVPGDTVMLVSPAGPARPERLERGVALFTSWGLRVELAPFALERRGYLAGTDEQRLADLNLALRSPEVRAVICVRGGYGAQRIVDGIDLAAARADPKLVVGFSDITALQLALWRGAGLPSLHGPMAAWNDARTGPESVESLRRALFEPAEVTIPARDGEETSGVRSSGRASGVLLGGNLCLLNDSVGTRDLPSLAGAILLVEEVEEPPYKVDRMLVHLRRAGFLDGVAAVAVGQFTLCEDDSWSTTIVDVLTEHLGALGVPLLGGLPIGHGPGQLTVPVGVPAVLDADAGTLTTEPATVPSRRS